MALPVAWARRVECVGLQRIGLTSLDHVYDLSGLANTFIGLPRYQIRLGVYVVRMHSGPRSGI